MSEYNLVTIAIVILSLCDTSRPGAVYTNYSYNHFQSSSPDFSKYRSICKLYNF